MLIPIIPNKVYRYFIKTENFINEIGIDAKQNKNERKTLFILQLWLILNIHAYPEDKAVV